MTDYYRVIKPEQSLSEVGLSYQDLLEMWTTWFISDNPDGRNYSNKVLFLRGLDFPESLEKIGYSGQPAAMVGTHSLNISEDQYLFLPVINTFVIDDEHAKTVQERNFILWRDTSAGDNPPQSSQITIDKEHLNSQLFFTISRDFTLEIPDVTYGRSLKDYLDIPLTVTGERRAAAAGWCILFKFTPPAGEAKSYSVAFHARGVIDPFGQYYAAGIYTINVSPSELKAPGPAQAPSIIRQRLHGRLEVRKQKGEISTEEYRNLKSVIDSL